MRIVVAVMFVFIVYYDVCDTSLLRVVAYFLSVNLLHNYVHCLCSLCVAPTFSLEGIKNFLT